MTSGLADSISNKKQKISQIQFSQWFEFESYTSKNLLDKMVLNNWKQFLKFLLVSHFLVRALDN